MHYTIITGTSRGIGESMARLLLEQGQCVLGIARTFHPSLDEEYPKHYHGFEADLTDSEKLEPLMERIFGHISIAEAGSIHLVNNAAALLPLREISLCEPQEIANHVKVNLIAPMIMTSLFARLTKPYKGDKRILNISSASANILLPDMSCYSTTKAGLDVFSKCAGLEQQKQEDPVRIASVWPGMIETRMQEELRNQQKEGFSSADIFLQARDKGMLMNPMDTAKKLVELLQGDSFPQGQVVENLDPL
ncbi:SDR family NAD(P)-dependent oxidoreductase [Paenibacillus ginsengarvi]|uniref:SDR family NAD(P)-dependent oxidoreductase n=1 Tax=Paenibacillus ginsengarvi TaxID=400777 RepID=A0A3B0AUH2_9BACL|nr:SDR family NAD(P)-dependent oxidoreductase [Paenibacillus ginsengarvi]RKN64182.1 SDR family NAD(P)-dependent oxidoreductase [Paenibacillus ginsengarvi]